MESLAKRAYLSTDEAAEYLGFSKSLLYKMTSKSVIKHIKITKKLLRFKKTDLDEFMDKYKVEAINDYKLI